MSKGRLPSFRSPRDLTLGGRNEGTKSGLKPGSLTKSILGADADKKKKFAPNLNVQRKDTKAKADSTNGANASSSSGASGWKKNSKVATAKAKSSSKPELIQVSGMFSDGLGNESESKKGWARKDTDRETRNIERPKVDFNIKYDKAAEEKKLKALLRDDFIDDLKTGHLVPVQLPMTDTGKVFKEESDDVIAATTKKRRNRILDSDDEEEKDEEEKISAVKNGKVTDDGSKLQEDLTFSHLLNEKRSELLFFQLPDHLPSRKAVVKAEEAEGDSKVTLNRLSEGYLGKLQLRKSGKVQLWINDVLFDVDIGTQVGFLQELYSVDTNGSQGNMTNLGRVRNRVIAMPAWEELFSATTMDEDTSSSDDEDDDDNAS